MICEMLAGLIYGAQWAPRGDPGVQPWESSSFSPNFAGERLHAVLFGSWENFARLSLLARIFYSEEDYINAYFLGAERPMDLDRKELQVERLQHFKTFVSRPYLIRMWDVKRLECQVLHNAHYSALQRRDSTPYLFKPHHPSKNVQVEAKRVKTCLQ